MPPRKHSPPFMELFASASRGSKLIPRANVSEAAAGLRRPEQNISPTLALQGRNAAGNSLRPNVGGHSVPSEWLISLPLSPHRVPRRFQHKPLHNVCRA